MNTGIKKKSEMRKCPIPGCDRERRYVDLCNKHRMWKLRGHINEKLEVVSRPKFEREPFRNKPCSISHCNRTSRNSICARCNLKIAKGTMDEQGRYTGKHARNVKSCKVCEKEDGKIRRGFCPIHYNQFRIGVLDADGDELRPLKRAVSYKGVKCKISDCEKNAKTLGFCISHYGHYQRGSISVEGVELRRMLSKNKGQKCSHCEKPAHNRGFCHKHYYRFKKRLPLNDKDMWVNKGKTCSTSDCKRPAYVEGLCSKHSYRKKAGLPVSDNAFFINKGKTCDHWGCTSKARTKGFCYKHYSRFMKGKPMDDVVEKKIVKRKKVRVSEELAGLPPQYES